MDSRKLDVLQRLVNWCQSRSEQQYQLGCSPLPPTERAFVQGMAEAFTQILDKVEALLAEDGWEFEQLETYGDWEKQG